MQYHYGSFYFLFFPGPVPSGPVPLNLSITFPSVSLFPSVIHISFLFLFPSSTQKVIIEKEKER